MNKVTSDKSMIISQNVNMLNIDGPVEIVAKRAKNVVVNKNVKRGMSMDFKDIMHNDPCFSRLLKDVKTPKLVCREEAISISFLQYLACLKQGMIIGYDQNRGDGKPSNKIVKLVSSNFDPYSFGMITVGDNEDGTMSLVDGHGRTQAITVGVKNRLIPSDMLDAKMTLRIVPKKKKLGTYLGLNQHNIHSLSETLSNTDLLFGSIIHPIVTSMGAEYPDYFLKRKAFPILSCIVFALNNEERKKDKYTSFSEAYVLRSEVTKLSKNIANKKLVRISPKAVKRLQAGLRFWKEYLEEIFKINPDLVKEYNQAGWMGVVIGDIVFSRPNNVGLLHQTPYLLARASCDKSDSALPYIRDVITQKTVSKIDNFIMKANRALRGEIK